MIDDAAPGPFLTDEDGHWTLSEIQAMGSGLRCRVPSGGAHAVQAGSAREILTALVGLEGWAGTVHLLPPGVGHPVVDSGPGLEIGGTRWTIYTSGTTGEPKPIHHTRASLERAVGSRAPTPYKWGLLYDPSRMAGLQVLLRGLSAGEAIVVPAPNAALTMRLAFLRRHGVDALSATPTLWRKILQSGLAEGWDLRQITLGGEIADQKVLDALAAAFPAARLTHVFASTETGAAFSVSDGKAGFPARYLSDPPRGISLEVRNGILHVHSPEASGAPEDGFVPTGDVVEVRGDRVFYHGRASGMVNVGGSKVWPEEVEQAMRRHPQVVDATVRAQPNPFTGSILVAEVAASDGAPADLGQVLRLWLKQSLPGHMVPARIRIVDEIACSTAGKATRA